MVPSPKKVVISVTQEDIERSRRYAPPVYPLLLAARRAFDKKKGVYGSATYVDLDDGRRYRLPPMARIFAESFDRGEELQPVELTAVREER